MHTHIRRPHDLGDPFRKGVSVFQISHAIPGAMNIGLGHGSLGGRGPAK
jgi:hypothetical protein